MDKHEENERPEYRSLTTDIAIGLGPTAAVVAAHLLSKGRSRTTIRPRPRRTSATATTGREEGQSPGPLLPTFQTALLYGERLDRGLHGLLRGLSALLGLALAPAPTLKLD